MTYSYKRLKMVKRIYILYEHVIRVNMRFTKNMMYQLFIDYTTYTYDR